MMRPRSLDRNTIIQPHKLASESHHRPLYLLLRLLRMSDISLSGSATDQSEWGDSWPAIIADLACSLGFIIASVCVMFMNVEQVEGLVYLRVWIGGYAVQCGVHVVCVCLECKRKWDRVVVSDGESSESVRDENSDSSNVVYNHGEEERTSLIKHLESANTVFSFFWWIIGFYWIFVGDQNLTNDSPQLYWLCIAFLVLDVFFVIICVAVASVRIAICLWLPCIQAILSAMEDQEGEVERFLQRFPRYRFQRINGVFGEKQNEDSQDEEPPIGKMTECNIDTPIEHVLPLEDAVCCICLSAYEDGNLLRRLPCLHHFHSACISRWLYLDSTCPLCKKKIFEYNI